VTASSGGPRIEPLAGDAARAAAADVGIADAFSELSIYQMLLRHPQLARAFDKPLVQLLFRNRLDARLRELVIMRIAWVTACCYEWTQHWRVARDLGVEDADLLGVRDWEQHAAFGPAERAVLAATDETVRDGAMTDPTWNACRDAVGGDDEALLELVTAIGWWRMVASLLENLRVPLEPGVSPWPPDGHAPPDLDQG
jgi:alkylhydroperoxidase family enzyme